jgi:hypothetical protein
MEKACLQSVRDRVVKPKVLAIGAAKVGYGRHASCGLSYRQDSVHASLSEYDC